MNTTISTNSSTRLGVILCLFFIAKDFYYFAHDYMSLERLTLKSFIELGIILACLRRAREED